MTSTEDETYESILLKLGKISSFDIGKYAQTTKKSTVTHFNLLLRNGIDIQSDEVLRNLDLDKLKDKSNKNLSDQYKYQIAMSIKRVKHFIPNLPKSVQLTHRRKNKSSIHRMRDPKFMSDCKLIIDETCRIIKDVSINNEIKDFSMYFTCLVILFTVATNMRIEEILSLTIDNLSEILKTSEVYVKMKHQRATIKRKFYNTELLTTLISTIMKQRQFVEKYLIENKHNPLLVKRLHGFKTKLAFLSSTTTLRKNLKMLAASLGISRETQGFNMFRKYMTTVLTNDGKHLLAQLINNHSSLDTTMDNYYVQSAETVENAFQDFALSIVNNKIPEYTNVHSSVSNLKNLNYNLPYTPPPTPMD